jgi:hypothetical protein
MSTPEELALHFVRWYCREGENDLGPYLAETFIFDTGLGAFPREEFLCNWRRGGLIDRNMLGIVSCPTGFGVVMEVTDTVTSLRHRMAFVGTLSGEQIIRVWSSKETVYPMDV